MTSRPGTAQAQKAHAFGERGQAPAPGHPDLAAEIAGVVAPVRADGDA